MFGTDGNTRKDGISFLDKDELVKKMNMDSKVTANIFDYVSTNDLMTFNSS